ncbi:hypothetical protein [Streptomyces sp. NPDC093589]|uniref:hypothetical protein n=1 Tax=Streptomyces sp. NPDC093589 TaxID=3366043 RepID=UPI0038079866
MTDRPSADQAALALRETREYQGAALTARQEPLRVKVAWALVGLAFGASYDVFDDPGSAPVLMVAAVLWAHGIASRAPRGAALLGYGTTGARNRPPAYVLAVLTAVALLMAIGYFTITPHAAYLNDHVPYWHTMGMLLLIMVTTALTPLDIRFRKWLFKLISKRAG